MLYRTDRARVVAHNDRGSGSEEETHSKSIWLLKTDNGHFFLQAQSRRRSEIDRLEPVSRDRALREFKELPHKEMAFRDAFPETVK